MPCLFTKPSLDQRPGVTEQVAWPVHTDAGQGEATQEGLAPWRARGALMGVPLAASKAPLALCPAGPARLGSCSTLQSVHSLEIKPKRVPGVLLGKRGGRHLALIRTH